MSNEKIIAAAFDPELLRDCASTMGDLLADHLAKVQTADQPVQIWSDPKPNIQQASQFVQQPVANDVRKRFAELIRVSLQRGQNLGHPRYIGHQVPAPIPLAGIFDAVMSATNQVLGVYEMGPWGVSVELRHDPADFAKHRTWWIRRNRHLRRLIGQFDRSIGRRSVSAPDAWTQGADQRSVLVVHGDSHYCIDRSAAVMGMGTNRVIRVAIDNERRMNPKALDAVLADLAARNIPVTAVVSVAGTTAIGAFDPLDAIADVCQRHGVWLHVDAAHGGGVGFSPKHQSLIRGLQRADSVAMDAHKMMFLPAVCAFVFYKNPNHRFAPFQQSAPYLFDPSAAEMEEYNNGTMTFECTRRASAFALWGIWAMFGPELFAAMVDQVIQVADDFYRMLCKDESFEASFRPQSNIVVFRFLPPLARSQQPLEQDRLQLAIRRSLLQAGAAYLTQTSIDGRIYLRSTIMNPLTQKRDLRETVKLIKEHGQRL